MRCRNTAFIACNVLQFVIHDVLEMNCDSVSGRCLRIHGIKLISTTVACNRELILHMQTSSHNQSSSKANFNFTCHLPLITRRYVVDQLANIAWRKRTFVPIWWFKLWSFRPNLSWYNYVLRTSQSNCDIYALIIFGTMRNLETRNFITQHAKLFISHAYNSHHRSSELFPSNILLHVSSKSLPFFITTWLVVYSFNSFLEMIYQGKNVDLHTSK